VIDWKKEIETLEGWSFGSDAQMADELASLTASGKNTANCFLLKNQPLPVVGERSCIQNSKGQPVCVVEVAKADVVRFCDVDEAFAIAEGYSNLSEWQAVHLDFFRRQDPSFTAESKIVRQWFNLLHRF
jgi:uncharacterized protein YhfF